MCIIKPFRVEQTPFLRDVGFLALAVLLMLIILWDEWLAYWEAGLLVGLYVLYAAVVVIGNWWQAKQDRKRRIESLMRSEYREDVVPYHDERQVLY
jgi:sodium/potassium/calcium exchanger 6